MARFTPLIPSQADDDTRPPGSEELLQLGAAIGEDLDEALMNYEDDHYPAALASLEQAERHLHQFRERVQSQISSNP